MHLDDLAWYGTLPSRCALNRRSGIGQAGASKTRNGGGHARNDQTRRPNVTRRRLLSRHISSCQLVCSTKSATTTTEETMNSGMSVYMRPDIYDMEYAGSANDDARFFARLLASTGARRVVEMACGTGRVTLTLAAALPRAVIVGVDSSMNMLGQAVTKRARVEP